MTGAGTGVCAFNETVGSAPATAWCGPDRTTDPITTITSAITSALHSRMTIGY
jgi:hypothetical protein